MTPEKLDKKLNPLPEKDFDPKTFEPNDVPPEMRRERKEAPRILPTMGLKPKAIMEGQMVGMYEDKQNLYLLIAALYERVSALEDELHGKREDKLGSGSEREDAESDIPPRGSEPA